MISKLYVALLLVLFSASGTSTALAAKAGDKGKGWKVIVGGSNGNLQCVYNGKFKNEGNVRDVNSATGGPCPRPRPPIIADTKGKKSSVSLGKGGEETVWTIKSGSGGAETIAIARKKKYLTPLTKVLDADWNTDVDVGLVKKKSRFRIRSNQVDDNSIDCLNDVDLLSSIGTHLSYDCASNEFRYDSDESSWNLIPI